jgi:dTDP-4-amino-4,6-dideoxygalactose transaminase
MTISFSSSNLANGDREALLDIVYRVALSKSFILGSNVSVFEGRFCCATGATHAIAVHSGRGALGVALRSVGIRPGDEVILQAFGSAAVPSEVINCGATPVFVDIDRETLVMDPARIATGLTERTKVILPAHQFSRTGDMPEIMSVAAEHKHYVIEDASGQQGALLEGGARVGLTGDIGVFSLNQTEGLQGCGEAGMIVTQNEALAHCCRKIRNHGQDLRTRFHHERIGVNSRMDEIVAASLLHRLDKVELTTARRRAIAGYYDSKFENLRDRLRLPPEANSGHCFTSYLIQTSSRDALHSHLGSRGIETYIHCSRPLPMQYAFERFASPAVCISNSVNASRENLALPIYPELKDEEVEVVADAVLGFFQ